MRFNVSPSDFWKLTPYEWWLLYDEFCIINNIADKEPDIDVDRLLALLELPEARPTVIDWTK